MISLTNVSKIYRTGEIEYRALDNVNHTRTFGCGKINTFKSTWRDG